MNLDKKRAEAYRNKAEEIRVKAEAMKDQNMRRVMLTMARDYDALADRLAPLVPSKIRL